MRALTLFLPSGIPRLTYLNQIKCLTFPSKLEPAPSFRFHFFFAAGVAASVSGGLDGTIRGQHGKGMYSLLDENKGMKVTDGERDVGQSVFLF